MSERTIRDSTGTEWRVLEVRPTSRDRRGGTERRRAAGAGSPAERRRGTDRRVRAGSRALLGETYQGGWLCFVGADGAGERRRVAPIPADWQTLPDHQLARLIEGRTGADGRGREARGG